MYADPSHRKDIVIKVRLDERCADLFRRYAAALHMQPAPLARRLIENLLIDHGVELPGVERTDPLEAIAHNCARREGLVDAEWKRRVIEQYLARHGYELPDGEDCPSRMAG